MMNPGEAASLSIRREQHAQALAEGLERLVQQLSRMAAVQQIILFGSYAAGRRDLFTDLDVLVVMESSLDFVRRGAELARSVDIGVPLDLLVYTPAEMEQMRHRPFLCHVMQTGKVLYERDRAL